MNLGLSGRLTRATIRSPLTPLFLLAAIAVGLLALMSIPREEEPQISVPMVDIMVAAPGLRAPDAVELVGKPLETIVKSVDGVEHVYTLADDDQVMVTARFKVGHRSGRRGGPHPREGPRQLRPHSRRHPRAADRQTRGINDVPGRGADPVAQARRGRPAGPTRRSTNWPASCAPRSPRSTTSA